MTGVPDPVRALADNATPVRPIPEWWSADQLDEVLRSWRILAALAPDLARVAADLAEALREIGILGCEHKKVGEGYAHNLRECKRCRALAAYEQLQARAGDET